MTEPLDNNDNIWTVTLPCLFPKGGCPVPPRTDPLSVTPSSIQILRLSSKYDPMRSFPTRPSVSQGFSPGYLICPALAPGTLATPVSHCTSQVLRADHTRHSCWTVIKGNERTAQTKFHHVSEAPQQGLWNLHPGHPQTSEVALSWHDQGSSTVISHVWTLTDDLTTLSPDGPKFCLLEIHQNSVHVHFRIYFHESRCFLMTLGLTLRHNFTNKMNNKKRTISFSKSCWFV